VFSWIPAINTRGTKYKCLEPSTGRVYISRDAIFDEMIFPFSSLHANVGAHLKAKILLLHPTLRNPQEGDGVDLSNVPNVADSLVESYVGSGEEIGGENSSIHSVPSSVNPVPPLAMDPMVAADRGVESDVDSGVAQDAAVFLDRA
jgi:hypothetical protein